MTVVFFCPNILRDAHRNIFQLDRLKEEGFNFILLDATKFYGNVSTATEEIILKNKIECANIEEFVSFKKKLPKEPVLFVTFDLYMKFAAPVFKIIIRDRDKLLSYHTKRFASLDTSTNKFRVLLEEFVIKLNNFLPTHHFGYFYKKFYNLYIPDYYLCSTKFLIPTKVYLTIKKKNRITVHADDINHIINEGKSIIDGNKKIGVFLDQGIPFLNRTHPLLYKDPFPENYLEDYYRMLENSLNNLKEKLGLDEVVIALHPDAIKFKEELTGKFSQFRTFIGVTKDLIKDAHVVFGHSSTAFSFAIYYKKPLIILIDDFLMNYHPKIRSSILFFAEELGMKCINMNEKVKITDMSEVPMDVDKYEDYTRKYLKDNNIQGNSFYYAIIKINQDLDSKN